MRIDRLEIPANRNLRNFKIDFDERAPMTVLLGLNGSGKSNLIENLVEIFLALEKGQAPSFKYAMTYFCHQKRIEVEADPQAKKSPLRVKVDGEAVSAKSFRDKANEYLPTHIFAYYSGTNSRLEKLFRGPLKKYYNDNLYENPGYSKTDLPILRRFFLCRKEYGELAFLSLFFEDTEFAHFIRNKILRFESFESALFVLKTPWWIKSKTRNDFYWGAKGRFTDFIDRLRKLALAPIKNAESLELDVRGRVQDIERLYLFIQNLEQLHRLRAPNETTKLMFNHLESMYLSDLLEEVRVSGHHASGQRVSMQQLSEGERQLVLVFGLLLFTHEDEVLYLLDEPDSHLNPRWVYEYMDWLGKAFRSKEGGQDPNQNPLLTSTEPNVPGASQVILATHNPLMIGKLRRNQVRIMPLIEGQAATEPELDPLGFGIDGLLMSDFFELESVLPDEILKKIRERNTLFAKKERSDAEDVKLKSLSFELSHLGILKTYLDPEQQKQERERVEAIENSRRNLSIEQIVEMNEKADKILEQLFLEENL